VSGDKCDPIWQVTLRSSAVGFSLTVMHHLQLLIFPRFLIGGARGFTSFPRLVYTLVMLLFGLNKTLLTF